MIYLDTSVVLAELLAEDRFPPAGLWDETIVSSRLLLYETWNVLHSRGLAKSHGDAARSLTERIAFLELAQPVLARALDPFPHHLRTLDALHLASADFIRAQGQKVSVATYDARMKKGARSLGFPLYRL